jgi:outer membrane lipoprotein-sorting protein
VIEESRLAIGISFRPSGMTRRAVLGALVMAPFAGLAAGAARAADAPMALTESERAELKRISVYLDGIRTMRAGFRQTSANGGIASGKIYLRRPGLIRVEYEPPVPVLLVADGHWLDYYDSELDQLSRVPVSRTPIWMLLQDTIDFSQAITVTRIEHPPGALRVSFYRTENPDAGTLSLTLAEDPLQLKEWTIRDSQGARVDIALEGAVFGGSLPDDLFAPPRLRRHHGQRIVD